MLSLYCGGIIRLTMNAERDTYLVISIRDYRPCAFDKSEPEPEGWLPERPVTHKRGAVLSDMTVGKQIDEHSNDC